MSYSLAYDQPEVKQKYYLLSMSYSLTYVKYHHYRHHTIDVKYPCMYSIILSVVAQHHKLTPIMIINHQQTFKEHVSSEALNSRHVVSVGRVHPF